MSDELGENTETELMKEVNVPNEVPQEIDVSKMDIGADPGTEDVKTEAEEISDVVGKFQGRKLPKHVPDMPITHLKNPDTKRVFPANETIMKQKHLVPCDENGNLVPDNRQLGRF